MFAWCSNFVVHRGRITRSPCAPYNDVGDTRTSRGGSLQLARREIGTEQSNDGLSSPSWFGAPRRLPAQISIGSFASFKDGQQRTSRVVQQALCPDGQG